MILLHNDNIMHIHRIIYTNLTHQAIGQLLQITYFSECYLKKNIGFSILLGTCEKNVKKTSLLNELQFRTLNTMKIAFGHLTNFAILMAYPFEPFRKCLIYITYATAS